MLEQHIQMAVKKLHGEKNLPRKHLYHLTMRDVNDFLVGGHPHINLMFGPPGSGYHSNKQPGFINVPANFDSVELKEFVREHVGQCREAAKVHCEKERVKAKVREMLQRNHSAN